MTTREFWQKSIYATVLLALVIFVLAFAATAWRNNQAPDVFNDEILYARAGQRIASDGALVWDHGDPLLVHPPMYFLAEALFFRLEPGQLITQKPPSDIFAQVYDARYFNALLAGVTALLLFFVGKRLRGTGLGLLVVALFVIDPFGVRINRRAMIETMAGLLVLAGMTTFLTRNPRLGIVEVRPSVPRTLAAGLLLGAALLTKEMTFTALLALILFGVWEIMRYRKQQTAGAATSLAQKRAGSLGLWSPFLAVVVAVMTYLLYPLWLIAGGSGPDMMSVKLLSLQRLLGLVQLTGWNRPGVSLADFLTLRLIDYGSSYLLLGLGGVAVLWLFLMHRHERTGRLLASWGLFLYPFYSFVAVFGSGNDQFFYFLLVPAMLLLGYVASVLPEDLARFSAARRARRQASGRAPVRPQARWTGRVARLPGLRNAAVAVLLVVILPYNVYRWWSTYGVGVDNGYEQLATYVESHLPPGTMINATGDAIKFEYFLPGYVIGSAGTVQQAQAAGIQYYALAPKDVWAHYGTISPQLANWIMANGQRLFATTGDSYGDIYLYRVAAPGGQATVLGKRAATFHWLVYHPAQGAFVNSFVVALLIWLLLVGWLAFIFGRREVLQQHGRVPAPVEDRSASFPAKPAAVKQAVEAERDAR